MRAAALSFLLTAGLCCMFACLGEKKEEPQVKALPEKKVPNRLAVDPRHQRRIKAVEAVEAVEAEKKLALDPSRNNNVVESPIDLSHDEERGNRPGAKGSAEHFVNRFIQLKHKVKVRFRAPESLIKYMPDDQEWRIFGTLRSKDNRQGYSIECFVKLNEEDAWECRRIHVDGRRVYDSSVSSPDIDLPNVRTKANGTLIAEKGEPEELSGDDHARSEDNRAEKRATAKLKLAKRLMKRSPRNAKKRLKNIVDEHPETEAAEEARALLKK